MELRLEINKVKYHVPNIDKFEVGGDYKNFNIYSQNDPRWKNKQLGKSKYTIGSDGCFITALGSMCKKRPDEVNDILTKKGIIGKAGMILNSDKAAKVLGLDYNGRDYNINNMPNYSPSIKEVKMGKGGKHFVLRIIENKKRYIIDSWDGQKKPIRHYEFISYRLFKQKK